MWLSYFRSFCSPFGSTSAHRRFFDYSLSGCFLLKKCVIGELLIVMWEDFENFIDAFHEPLHFSNRAWLCCFWRQDLLVEVNSALSAHSRGVANLQISVLFMMQTMKKKTQVWNLEGHLSSRESPPKNDHNPSHFEFFVNAKINSLEK